MMTALTGIPEDAGEAEFNMILDASREVYITYIYLSLPRLY